jgi:hypothetical protein
MYGGQHRTATVSAEKQSYRRWFTYGQEAGLHELALLSIGLHPSLRSPLIGILAKDILVAVHDPGVHANDSAGGDELSFNLNTTLRGNALKVQTEGGVDTAGLVDTGLKERQLLGLLPGDDAGQLAVLASILELLAETSHGLGLLDEVLEHGAQEDGGGVATSQNIGDGPGLDGPVTLLELSWSGRCRWNIPRGKRGVTLKSLEETGKEVTVADGLTSGTFSETLLTTSLGEVGERVGDHGEDDTEEGVLGEEVVEPRHLSDLIE